MNFSFTNQNSDLPDPIGDWVRFHRLDFEFTGKFKHGQPAPDPVLREGRARVVNPGPGVLLRGILVDCPVMDSGIGCVVIDTDIDPVAVQSHALCDLMIEHAPCHLEFVAVSRRAQAD